MKNTFQLKTKSLTLLLLIFGISACDDVTEPPNPNEEELITTVELTFVEGPNTKVFRFADPDGDGGNFPTEMDTIKLNANTTYTLAVSFLDESDSNDVENITEEVQEEADEHLVCYSVDGGTSVSITDKDGNDLDLGLAADVTTTDAAEGTFTISLKHQPDAKDGSCDVGETDVEVAFVLEVE